MKNSQYIFSNKTYKILLLFWTIIVFTLLLMPQSSFSHAPRFPFLAFLRWKHMDKVVHFVMFAIESWLVYRVKEQSKRNIQQNTQKKSYLGRFTIISIFSMGLFTEILQGLTYNTQKRCFSLWDLLFDTLASIFVVVVINCIFKKIKLPF